MFIADNC